MHCNNILNLICTENEAKMQAFIFGCIQNVLHLYLDVMAQSKSETRRTMPEESVMVKYLRFSIALITFFSLSNF